MDVTAGPGEESLARFRTSDGVSIAYRRWGTEGRPVVLQHGFASDTDEDWVRSGVVTALRRAGLSVIGVDARGHGGSDAPRDAEAYGAPRSALDLIELADELDLHQVDLVGYSMGAVIALNVAATAPALVRRLVIGGVGSSIVELGGVDTRVLPSAILAETFRIDDSTQIVDPGLAAWRAAVDAAGQDRLALALIAETMDAGGVDLDKVVAPTLLLAGDEDPLIEDPFVVTEAMADGRLVTVHGDHTQARYDPLFADSIVAFLAADLTGR